MNFLEIIKEYKVWGVLIVCVLVFLYGLARSNWVSDHLSIWRDKISNILFPRRKKEQSVIDKNITESDIINHDIFNFIDFWVNSQIPTMKFSTDYRTAVFRMYLTVYLKKHKETLIIFVQSKKYQKMDKSTLWNNFLQLLNNTIYNYEKEMRESGIPDVIIDKVKIKNNDLITLTIDITSGICNSNFYDSDKNLLKIYSILNIMFSILESSIGNSEYVFRSINGELKGLTFAGFREPR